MCSSDLDIAKLTKALAGPDVTVTASTEPELVTVSGMQAARIGELAAGSGVVLHELTPVTGSLEEAYLALTEDEVEYHAGSFENEVAS